jgi:hypothetical protein
MDNRVRVVTDEREDIGELQRLDIQGLGPQLDSKWIVSFIFAAGR